MITIEVWMVYLGYILIGAVMGFVLSAISRREARRQYQEWREVSREMRKYEQDLKRRVSDE